MKIIDLIESLHGGVTFKVANTKFYLRLKGNSVDNIIFITNMDELWLRNLDARMLSTDFHKLQYMAKILDVSPIACFEYEDKYCYVIVDKILMDNLVYKRTDDYLYIPKEYITMLEEVKHEGNITAIQTTISGDLSDVTKKNIQNS